MRQRPPISGVRRRLVGYLPALARGRRGAAAVEFGLVAPALLLLIFGVLESGRALWVQNALNLSVEQAARCASIDKNNCGTSTQITNYAATVAGAGFTASNFTATQPACGNLVTATFAINLYIPMIDPHYTVTAQSCYPK